MKWLTSPWLSGLLLFLLLLLSYDSWNQRCQDDNYGQLQDQNLYKNQNKNQGQSQNQTKGQARPSPVAEDSGCQAYGHYHGYLEEEFKVYKLDEASTKGYFDFCHSACLHLIIREGRIYVKRFIPGYESRTRATLLQVFNVWARFGSRLFPDADIILDVTDGDYQTNLPVFYISRKKAEFGGGRGHGVLYPDFTFFSWPESICAADREISHSYISLHENYRKLNDPQSERYKPFSSRTNKLLWRGGKLMTNKRDVALHNLLRLQDLQRQANSSMSTEIDVAYMTWHGNNGVTGTVSQPDCTALIDECGNKFLAFLPGNTYSSRLKFQLQCGSVVIKGPDTFEEWWSPFQADFKLHHGNPYLELSNDTFDDAEEKIAFLEANPKEAEKIAMASRKFTEAILNPEAVACYWLKLIELSSKYLPQDRDINVNTLKPIEDVLMLDYSHRIVETKKPDQ